MNETMLYVRGLSKFYGRARALEGLDLAVTGGSAHALLGANGSGKSTALHSIVGVISPSSGSVTIGGFEAESPPAKALLGFLADDAPLPLSLTGREYLALHASLHGAYDRDWAGFLVDELGLSSAQTKFLSEYSHGMRRKIQLVGALAHHPELLVLDEPYRGLDPEAAFLMETITRLFVGSGGALLVSTHDLEHAERTFDTVTIVAEGTPIETGTPLEIRERHGATDLRGAYLAAARRADDLQAVAHRFEQRWNQDLISL